MKYDIKILLVCGLGMSTSLLVNDMKKKAKDNYLISCSDVVSAQVKMCEYDIVLLAPHINYMKKSFMIKAKCLHIPLILIDKRNYQEMNSQAILNTIENVLVEYQRQYPFKIILLHASGGVMSDLIMIDMKKKLNEKERDWVIESIDIEKFNYQESFADIILIEPQIKFKIRDIEKQVGEESLVIIDVPSREKYSSFDGRIVLDYINEMYEYEFKKRKTKVKKYMEDTYEDNF